MITLNLSSSFKELNEWYDTVEQLIISYKTLINDIILNPDKLTRSKLSKHNQLLYYIKDGKFPINAFFEKKTPIFVDNQGNYCAIANLITQDFNIDLVSEIRSNFNYSKISDMKSKNLELWLDKNNLTLKEAEIIQPQYGLEVFPVTWYLYFVFFLLIFIGPVFTRDIIMKRLFKIHGINKLNRNLENQIGNKNRPKI